MSSLSAPPPTLPADRWEVRPEERWRSNNFEWKYRCQNSASASCHQFQGESIHHLLVLADLLAHTIPASTHRLRHVLVVDLGNYRILLENVSDELARQFDLDFTCLRRLKFRIDQLRRLALSLRCMDLFCEKEVLQRVTVEWEIPSSALGPRPISSMELNHADDSLLQFSPHDLPRTPPR